MADEYISNGSFKFGTTDMYNTFGIRLVDVVRDNLIPQKRERKVEVPQRSGKYDYGAKRWDERTVGLDCVSMSNLSRAEWRELSYILSKKSKLYIFTEPEKYYIAELYDPAQLDRIPFTGMEFSLDFTCEPFAYGNFVVKTFTAEYINPQYVGTAYTPTRIEIQNTSSAVIKNITITIKEKV